MSAYEGREPRKTARYAEWAPDQKTRTGSSAFRFVDNRPQTVAQRAFLGSIANSVKVRQAKANTTGLPDQVKSGVEQLSGFSLDDVKVHYNSAKPAQLQAHAYAQGSDIFLASGQEHQLAHEAWHVVQQKQGRVRPTMQMAGKVNVNDDAALEREADVQGSKALQMKRQDVPAAPQLASAGGGVPQPVQRRFKQANVDYSFLEAHDQEGNPYLASRVMGVKKGWKIAAQQQGVQLEQVADLHEKVTDANRDVVKHNLSMGREQRVTEEGKKSILLPFKTYTFGPNKVPDVAVFNVGESGAEKGELYPHYKKKLDDILASYMNSANLDAARTAIAECKIEMLPLIGGEDYRTSGALGFFQQQWTGMEQAFARLHQLKQEAKPQTGRPKRGVADPVEEQEYAVKTAIAGATSKLPWAGGKGKEKFRTAMSASKGTWEESERPIDRSSMSPPREDTGGQWQMDDDEVNQLKKKPLAGGSAPAQCRFTQDGIQYSFLSAHDFNGNPFLASEHEGQVKNWKIKPVQDNFLLNEQASMYTPVKNNDLGAVYHNVSMGRQQRISVGGQKAILHPFKSYQFGVNTVPDVAVYNVGESGAEPAKLYDHYFALVKGTVDQYLKDRDLDKATSALDRCEAEMKPLIVAEDYRTRGALAHFEQAWQDLHTALLDVALHDIAPKLKPAKDSGEQMEHEDSYDQQLREFGADKQMQQGANHDEQVQHDTDPDEQLSEVDPGELLKQAMTPDQQLADVKALRLAASEATSGLPWAGTGGKQNFRTEMSATMGTWEESSRPVDRGGMSPLRDDTGGSWKK